MTETLTDPPLTGGGRATTWPVSKLKPYPGNPRQGDVAVIAESLRVNAQYRPIVVNGRTGEVLAGNHTLLAARRLGWTSIAVWEIDVDTAAAARIVAADNRTADLGGYDQAALAELLSTLSDTDDELLGTGYTEEDLGKMLASLAPVPGSAETLTDFANVDIDSQFGVIVLCDDEADQQRIYEELGALGRPLRVVTV